MQTTIINIYGAPGAGKSALAHGLMWKLKCAGIECEFAAEYAKDIVFEESLTKLGNQVYVFGKQYHRMRRIYGKVSAIVTDAPLLHSIVYDFENDKSFHEVILNKHHSFNNLNLYLTRNHPYSGTGRLQSEEKASEIGDEVLKVLVDNKIEIHQCESGVENLDKIFSLVESQINLNGTSKV